MSDRQAKILITLTGPSLSGKSTLEKMLSENGCEHLVSTTTRHPRAGEEHGEHYYFVSKEEFERGIREDNFIENIHFDGNYYGVSKDEAERAFKKGKPAVVVCEPNGAKQMHAYAQKEGWECVRVFVNNPKELLVERFLERFKNDEKATPKRYASRLQQMMGKEQQEWVEPALNGSAPYEMVIPSFAPESQEDALRAVLKKVEDIQAAQKTNPGSPSGSKKRGAACR